jgi:UDP-2,3-diacylglucosamine hydrolase
MTKEHIYFISDLHLTPEQPAITQGFLRLLEHIQGSQALYVLGDLFESWVGDDHHDDFNQSIIDAFQKLHQTGCNIYFAHGNRDFLLGHEFAKACGGELLNDETVIKVNEQKILIMHGDQLCTKDEKYMAFRAQSRDPEWQKMMLEKPLDQRLMIAQMWRMQSKMQNSNKPENIMDVNEETVIECMQKFSAPILLHGHTHRPNTHILNHNEKRLVLGDWREHEAIIGVSHNNQAITLETWNY